jgi:SWI/SNF-related matrix-associated actin-dependent regulator of chromatin subfamily A member 5
VYVGLTPLQREWYKKLVTRDMNLLMRSSGSGGSIAAVEDKGQGSDWRKLLNLMMLLRKLTNHPFLISAEAEPQWERIRAEEAAEDARLRREGKPLPPRKSIEQRAGEALIESSGKMAVLDKLLTKLLKAGHRVLIFSLFTRVLDLLEDYMSFKGWKYLRLDGSTNRVRRNVDIRRFNDTNSRFFAYLISTRAGGLGINLTGADTVIHFDSDFNPQVGKWKKRKQVVRAAAEQQRLNSNHYLPPRVRILSSQTFKPLAAPIASGKQNPLTCTAS